MITFTASFPFVSFQAEPTTWEQTPAIIRAAHTQDWALVRTLIERGVDPNTCSPEFGSLLSMAIREDEQEIVHLLLDKGASPRARDAKMTPCLMIAIAHLPFEIVEKMLDLGAQVNCSAANRKRPIDVAVNCGRINSVRELVLRGAVASPKHAANLINTADHSEALYTAGIQKFLRQHFPEGAALVDAHAQAQARRIAQENARMQPSLDELLPEAPAWMVA